MTLRSRSFDRLIEDSLTVARHMDPEAIEPEARGFVGRLETAIGSLFLADVRWGTASVPPSYKDKDGSALVLRPFRPWTHRVRRDGTFWMPTPRRKRLVADKLGVPQELADTIVERCAELTESELLKPVTVRMHGGVTDAEDRYIRIGNWRRVHHRTRPFIMLCGDFRSPSAVIHEIVHAELAEDEWTIRKGSKRADIRLIARHEAKAYNVGAEAERTTQRLGLPYVDTGQIGVNQLRCELGPNPRHPLEPTPDYMSAMIADRLIEHP